MRILCRRDKYRYIRVPIRFINENYGVDHNTNFCIDTGAPYSLISYEQAVEWGLPFDKLPRSHRKHRVGGVHGEGYLLTGSSLVLRDHVGKLHSLEVPRIEVLGPPFQQAELPVPALLGDDLLHDFSLVILSDRQGGAIILTDEKLDIKFGGPFES